MSSRPPSRSVKISADERTGWSSDRPRRDGAPPRPADLTVHCRVLAPTERLRYSPGSLLRGRVPDGELDARAQELLEAAVLKRLQKRETVVLAAETLAPDERERFLRIAAALRRPRHLIMLETAREQVPAEERTALNALRRALDAGELGREGVQTALRLGGGSAADVKRIVFRSAPRE